MLSLAELRILLLTVAGVWLVLCAVAIVPDLVAAWRRWWQS